MSLVKEEISDAQGGLLGVVALADIGWAIYLLFGGSALLLIVSFVGGLLAVGIDYGIPGAAGALASSLCLLITIAIMMLLL